MGQKWIVNADGGYLANPELSKKLRYYAQPMMKFGQFVRRVDAFGKNKGESWDFDKISNIATAASQTGIAENNTMPESKFTIAQSSGTVTEYGNSIPYSGKLEALAEFDPNNIAQRVLLNDQALTLDTIIARYFKAGRVQYAPTAADAGTFDYSNDDSQTAAVGYMSTYHAGRCIDELKRWKISPYDGENYICIGSIGSLRGMKNSTDWKNAALYGDPDRLFHGEVGMIDGCRFIECNNTDALYDFPIAAPTSGEAIFFGEDPVVEGVATPPELRAKVPTDYGRSKGVAWYALMGWATPWRYTTTTEEQFRIIHFTGNDNDGANATSPDGY